MLTDALRDVSVTAKAGRGATKDPSVSKRYAVFVHINDKALNAKKATPDTETWDDVQAVFGHIGVQDIANTLTAICRNGEGVAKLGDAYIAVFTKESYEALKAKAK